VTYDVRAIANFVLECAENQRRPLTNLSINKIVFFLHASCLIQLGRPLVTAKIEAWQFGPVFRELYHAFKKYDDRPIRERISRISPISGDLLICTEEMDPETEAFLKEETSKLLLLSATDLVAWSHEEDGPWEKVWNHKGASNASMRISDAQIREWFDQSKRN
jgi:uncharacterized phage-associated protein